MTSLLARLKNWKTTFMGSALGVAAAAIIAKLLNDAGCDFSTITWSSFVAFAFTQIVGALSTDNGKAVSVVLVALLLGACATKYEGVTSDFETFQVGPMCFTEGHGEMKFNAPTSLQALSCRCDQLVLTKRIVIKAGQSPEVLSCPSINDKESYVTQRMEPVTVHPMADNYVAAVGHALEGAFVGAGIGVLATANAPRMLQTVNQPINTSTMYTNSVLVPGGVAR